MRHCNCADSLKMRRLTDIRTTPLLIGITSFLWAWIPWIDFDAKTLFYTTLKASGDNLLWSAILMTIGVTLSVSALIKWRSMLLLSEALAIFMWLALFFEFLGAWYAPTVLTMPAFAISCAICLAREVAIGIRFEKLKNKKVEIRGFSDFLDSA